MFSTQMIHTQCGPIHKVHLNNLHTREPHTGCYPPSIHLPSLSWYQFSVHPPLAGVVSGLFASPLTGVVSGLFAPPLLGWYQACLACSRESKSGVHISLCDTCPNTLRSPSPLLSGCMDTTS